MADSRECFIKDCFISVQDCEEQQLKLSEGACDGCKFQDAATGSTQEEGSVRQTTEIKSKIPNFDKPCVDCGRTRISKPAGGMCPKCYLISKKKNAEEGGGKKKAVKKSKVPAVKKKAAAPLQPKPIELGVSYVLPREQEEPVPSPDLNTIPVFLTGMFWVIALYWLCGYDFERGKDLGGWFFGATLVGCALVFAFRHRPSGK